MSDLSSLYSSQSTYSDIAAPLVILDQQGLILETNDAWKEFGAARHWQAPHAGVGANYFQLHAKSAWPLADTTVQGIRRVLSGGATQYDEVYAAHSPAQPQWIHLHATQLRDQRHTMVIHEDVTALHQAQHDVLQGEERTTRILGNIQEACFTLDDEWCFTYLNSRAARLLQRPSSALLGQSFWSAFPETRGTEFEQHFRQAVREQRPVLFEAFFPVVYAWFEVNAYPYQGSLAVYFQNINVRRAEAQTHSERDIIFELIIHGGALPEILNHIARMVERQVPGAVCVILLAQDQSLYLSAAPSLSPQARVALKKIEGSEGWPCGSALNLGQQVIVEHLPLPGSSPELRDLCLQQGWYACVSAPLMNESNRPLGTLDLYATTPAPFSAEVLELVDRARHLAALATEHHRLAERVLYRAQYDSLTGLINRRVFEERLREAVVIAQKTKGPLALLFIDVDDFKNVNDLLGHDAGDQVLCELARRLGTCVQAHDTVARISGDEFTVMLPFSDQANAIEVAKMFLGTLTKPFLLGDREVYMLASVGISGLPEGGQDAESLQLNADLAMYRAKSHKTGFAVYESDFNRRNHDRFELANALRTALALKEFEVHYQPLVRLEDQSIIGVEALLSWHHPRLGRVPPDQFIPIAEETGLILEIGAWVLQTACLQGKAWLQEGLPPLRLAVNVSAAQFEHPGFEDMVARCLETTGFPAACLELELTERVVMSTPKASSLQLKHLRALGVSIAIDDFGTGYSSLSYLAQLPINILKIDRSFVTGLSTTSANYLIVKAIMGLAEGLQLVTVAEGIETVEELNLLHELGCHLGQGYLFARPTSATAISRMFALP